MVNHPDRRTRGRHRWIRGFGSRKHEEETVCIVGLDENCLDGLDSEDSRSEWWGLNQSHAQFAPARLERFTRWFQIHAWEPMVARQLPQAKHIEWLARCGIPVYLEERRDDIPMSVRYPFEEVLETLGNNYFATNSFGYMVALAIHERFKRIKIYGADFGPSDTSDAYARPCIEFLLGFAVAVGIEVWVPKASALLKGDLYGKTVDQSGLALEEALDVLRKYAGRLRYGEERLRVQEASDALERIYLPLVKGRARVGREADGH